MPLLSEQSQTLELIENVKTVYDEITVDRLDLLEGIYHEHVHFIDPAKDIRSLVELTEYFRVHYSGVQYVTFRYDDQVVEEGKATLIWRMEMRHKTFKPGQTVFLHGCSNLLFDSKIFYHRDYFDLGALVYERVPVLGRLVKKIKGKL